MLMTYTGGSCMCGLIHIYCGDGKGKTSAATGLAIRCSGAGKKVVFAQFLKNGCSSEISVLKNVDNIDICVCCKPHGFVTNMSDRELNDAKCDYTELLSKVIEKAKEGVDLLVLDEIISSCNLGIVNEKTVVEFLKNKPKELEVVLTGREPSNELLSLADYITEMKKIKHPFEKGISARKGIEF